MKNKWFPYVASIASVLLIVVFFIMLANKPSPSIPSSPSDNTIYVTKAPTYTYKASFTNQFGTSTTICVHSGCTNYIASSGDTNCCTTHSNRCAECNKYIDEDAAYCMDCIAKALN